ncbi:CesT family type III secretion system chaperone [Chromobacterium haemolyticum]|uniref:CesT family type III secretion system chaperone n=1 Tax=Chromobacterium haemolyticum TaxID=394935 RepID=UPI000AEC81F6|nr:CesT family type III secretion system chaperone [Chromobacterium haemolyticum]
MNTLLLSLYDTLGLVLDDEAPVLFFGDEFAVHFEESAAGLEMACPLGVLPSDAATLQRLLQHNFASPVTLAADADGELLLALLRLPDSSSGAELQAGLECLLGVARGLQTELGLGGRLDAEAY